MSGKRGGGRQGSRQNDALIIKALRGLMSAAMFVVGLGLATILFWILILNADSAEEVPQALVVMTILGLGVTVGCHQVIKWAKPVLR